MKEINGYCVMEDSENPNFHNMDNILVTNGKGKRLCYVFARKGTEVLAQIVLEKDCVFHQRDAERVMVKGAIQAMKELYGDLPVKNNLGKYF